MLSKENKKQTNSQILPGEIWIEILLYLPSKFAVLKFALVFKDFYRHVNKSSYLWRQFLSRDFNIKQKELKTIDFPKKEYEIKYTESKKYCLEYEKMQSQNNISEIDKKRAINQALCFIKSKQFKSKISQTIKFSFLLAIQSFPYHFIEVLKNEGCFERLVNNNLENLKKIIVQFLYNIDSYKQMGNTLSTITEEDKKIIAEFNKLICSNKKIPEICDIKKIEDELYKDKNFYPIDGKLIQYFNRVLKTNIIIAKSLKPNERTKQKHENKSLDQYMCSHKNAYKQIAKIINMGVFLNIMRPINILEMLKTDSVFFKLVNNNKKNLVKIIHHFINRISSCFQNVDMMIEPKKFEQNIIGEFVKLIYNDRRIHSILPEELFKIEKDMDVICKFFVKKLQEGKKKLDNEQSSQCKQNSLH
ncbi:MAG: hypothetical protein PVI75_04515 [Gammaproteobacteria bacterium]|jgi:hypothetical protein